MPGGDGSGPLGRGPRTGRAAGYCTGNDGPGSTTAGGFRGGGRGLGFRGGRMRRGGWNEGRGGWNGRGGGWTGLADVARRPVAPADTVRADVTGTDMVQRLERLQTELEELRRLLDGAPAALGKDDGDGTR